MSDVTLEAERRRAAIEELFRDRYVAMVRLALVLVDHRSIAEEVVQDAFRALWERIDQVVDPAAYLRVSVVNGCRGELRRREVRRRRESTTADVGVDQQEFLLDALDGLSERKKTALVMRFYGDLTTEEIAATMRVRPGTVKSLISRGLDDLRKVIR